MPTPNWHAVATAGTQSVSDITQFLGTHGCALLYQGVSQVTNGVGGGYTMTNTGSAAQWIDQPFTTGAAQTTITRIELWLAANGTGADTTIEIRTDNAGVPSNVTLFSIVFPAEFLVNLNESIPINLTGLSAATKYHIVIDGTASTSNWTQVNRGPTVAGQQMNLSASGTGGWSAGGFTCYFNVFAGVNGVLRNTYEDSGARWTFTDYTNSVAAGNTTPVHIGEYTVGTLRSYRTLTYTTGQLVSVA